MFFPRVIPCLLLKGSGLVKTVHFRDPRYLGDPLNAVRIFNEKEVNEIIFLDIAAARSHASPGPLIDLDMVRRIARECLVPLTYGGGVRALDDIQKLFDIGVEKVVINTAAYENAELIREAATRLGSQSVVVSIDAARTSKRGYEVLVGGGTLRTGIEPETHAARMESLGAGEIMINSIDRDGMMSGFDLELIRSVSRAVSIPVIACGGAGKLEDFAEAVNQGGASAVAAGSFFVYYGKMKAVLITYPEREDIERILRTRPSSV